YSCRTRVYEYGGGSFIVKSGILVFSNDADFRLYKIDLVNAPETIVAITPEEKLFRYANFNIDSQSRFLVCVREEHFEVEEPKDVVNVLVSVSLVEKDIARAVRVIEKGADFYAAPCLSSDDTLMAYISWNHSNMPWDFTFIHCAKVEYNDNHAFIRDSECVAGDIINESIMQPAFGIDNVLYFSSDRSGFWNLYGFYNGETELLLPEPLPQEFTGASSRLNSRSYAPFLSDANKLVCINKKHLAVLDTKAKTLTNLPIPYHLFSQVSTYNDNGKEVVITNAFATNQPNSLISYSVDEQSILRILKTSAALILDPADISVGKEIAFPTNDGNEAYCFFYEPKNKDYISEGKPPLRVMSHGGPTASTNNAYSLNIQYWTTRGFAIADVNYGGSDGYGKEYRNRLKKRWAIVDVDDCCNAALYLAEQGLVDREKLAIEGGSAGGLTTLASLAFRDVFKAGCSRFGISDITLLAKETHKFESKYLDQLIGEYPKDVKIYEERSPLFSAQNIKCPVIIFQGEDDKVVHPSQAEAIVDALKKGGVPVAYVLYKGEGHGFRLAKNIKRTIELEQWFYGQIFGFPVDNVEGIEIYNFHK
ncbi:Alpha/Beta hydrolase protein, partial [Spinellus fusiger]